MLITDIHDWFRHINWNPSQQELDAALRFLSDERSHVRKVFENLSWNAPLTEQQAAIQYLSENLLPPEYVFLVLPYQLDTSGKTPTYIMAGDKCKWENAAKTIVQIGWPKVDSIIVPLFMWLLDPNWPGSSIIYEFLQTLPSDVLHSKIRKIIDSSQSYRASDFNELMEILVEFCKDRGIDLIK